MCDMMCGTWHDGTGEERTTIEGDDYTYGWFADRNGECLGHAWYNHTKDIYVFKDPAICPACGDNLHRCKGKCCNA